MSKAIDIQKALSAPFRPEQIKDRVAFTDKNGNEVRVPYVEWHSVVERLNEVVPGKWSYEMQPLTFIDRNGEAPSVVAITARITIEDGEYDCFKEGIGVYTTQTRRKDGKVISHELITDLAIKAASSDALKRAAVNHGIGLHLYQDKHAGSQSYQQKQPPPRQAQPPQKLHSPNVQSPLRWQDIEIPFGKYARTKLGDLEPEQLSWWVTKWQPSKMANGTIDPRAITLREWLDAVPDEELTEEAIGARYARK